MTANDLLTSSYATAKNLSIFLFHIQEAWETVVKSSYACVHHYPRVYCHPPNVTVVCTGSTSYHVPCSHQSLIQQATLLST